MPVANYIAQQPADRQQVLNNIHDVIIKSDKTVKPVIELMMGKEMIVYKEDGMMKYALASVKKHMSLHLLPMYASPQIHAAYKIKLPEANFQKGCINFINADEMPLNIVQKLIADCTIVDLGKIRENYLKSKKPVKK